jgi:hypothetical protein
MATAAPMTVGKLSPYAGQMWTASTRSLVRLCQIEFKGFELREVAFVIDNQGASGGIGNLGHALHCVASITARPHCTHASGVFARVSTRPQSDVNCVSFWFVC